MSQERMQNPVNLASRTLPISFIFSKLIHDYLLNRKQRIKINSKYSSWVDILEGIPQGSILGPPLFNTFL